MGGAEPAQIRRLAMDYLARREHGSAELIEKLMQRGVETQAAHDTVDALSEEGLQDDQRFAELYARSQAARGKGPQYIRNGLRQRGVSSAEIDQALRHSEMDWWLLAEQVAAKKYPPGPCDTAQRASRHRFLQQRGFSSEQSSDALKALEQALDPNQ